MTYQEFYVKYHSQFKDKTFLLDVNPTCKGDFYEFLVLKCRVKQLNDMVRPLYAQGLKPDWASMWDDVVIDMSNDIVPETELELLTNIKTTIVKKRSKK